MLMGIEQTNDNYNTAIALLKERYGKKQVMIDLHYSQINNIPMASYKTASIREFYDCTEKHLGESNNQNNVLTMMKSELTRSVLLRLEEQREENEKWTVENFRKCLLRYIKIKEAADYQVRLLQRPKNFTRHPLKGQGQGYTSSTIEALLADESGKQRQRKKRCIYCKGEHWSDEYLRSPNNEVRKNKPKNRCLICLKRKP